MRLLATITVLLVTVSGCGLFKSEPGAPEITNDFLAKLASGDAVVAEVSRPDPPFQPGEQVHMWWEPGDELRSPASQ